MSSDSFERELERETEALLTEAIPAAITGLVLELRQEMEDQAPRGSGERGIDGPPLHRTFMAGPVVEPRRKEGSDEAARAALDTARPGDSLFAYSNDPRAYWMEFGTEKMAPRPIAQPALQVVGSRTVRV